jgi:hypothetical protein
MITIFILVSASLQVPGPLESLGHFGALAVSVGLLLSDLDLLRVSV